jgi:hypothetical protein
MACNRQGNMLNRRSRRVWDWKENIFIKKKMRFYPDEPGSFRLEGGSHAPALLPKFRRSLGLFHIGVRKYVQVDTILTNPLQVKPWPRRAKISRILRSYPGSNFIKFVSRSVSDIVPL